MKVLLHIGSEKTGTTSIQHWAAANREALAARGILYPKAPGERPDGRMQPNHVGLAVAVAERAREPSLLDMLGLHAAAAKEHFLATLTDRLAAEIAAAGCHTLLLSNEHLSSRVKTEEEVAALRRLVEEAAGRALVWQVVLYHRRQDEMVQSVHAMRVLNGHTRPFRLAARAGDPRLDPRPVLGCYAAVFGEAAVRVRPFDRHQLVGGDVVADVAALLGLDVAAPGFITPQRKNVSLGPMATELLRLLNPLVPRWLEQGTINPARRPLLAAIRALPPEPPALLAPRAELDRFLAGFAEVNAEIARRWAGRPDGVLFSPPDPAEDSLPVAEPLTAERAIAMLAPLLRRALKPPAQSRNERAA